MVDLESAKWDKEFFYFNFFKIPSSGRECPGKLECKLAARDEEPCSCDCNCSKPCCNCSKPHLTPEVGTLPTLGETLQTTSPACLQMGCNSIMGNTPNWLSVRMFQSSVGMEAFTLWQIGLQRGHFLYFQLLLRSWTVVTVAKVVTVVTGIIHFTVVCVG